MDQQLVAKFLTSDSDEISDLKANLERLEGFTELVQEINSLPDTSKRFYEESRSLYQTTAMNRSINDLERLLSKFFGQPIKPAGKTLPRKWRKSSVVKYLGGIEKDQSLFLMELKTGQFYGALWPWRRNKAKIEIHLGYCSDWMSDEDYQQLENLVHQCMSHRAFEQMDADIGGQIHGISLPSFLQMAEMEKSSFALRVTSRHRVGVLHLTEGTLIAAQLDDLAGCDAAYRIISWDDVSIDIEPHDASKKDEIRQPLMQVLMESLKLKDEAALPQETPPPLPPKGRPKTKPRPGGGRASKRIIRLERAPTPKVRPKRLPILMLVAIGVGIFSLMAAVVFGYFHYMDHRTLSDGYSELLSKVKKAETLEEEVRLYEVYQKERPHSTHHGTVESKIQELHTRIEDRDFEQTTLAISALPVDEHYEKQAIEMFGEYLEKYPDSRNIERINKSIAEIKNLLDKYYYEELKHAARLDFSKRLDTYRKYLEKFPRGKFKNDVEILIREMGEKYLTFLRDEAAECEQKMRWDECIQHCQGFIEAYAGHPLAQQGIQLKNKLVDQRDYIQLRRSATQAGNDYQRAYALYRTYLDQHPQSAQHKTIENEMAQLQRMMSRQQNWLSLKSYATDNRNPLQDRIQKVDNYLRANISSDYSAEAQSLLAQLQEERRGQLKKDQVETKRKSEQARLEQQRQEQARLKKRALAIQAQLEKELNGSGRYRTNGDSTFTDTVTGLTWCLLDSYQELGACVTYKAALEYVNNMRYGGQAAWRLPSANELAALYKQPPFFPDSGAEWYWSGETAVKGYHTVADVVSARHESVFQRDQRPLTECGAARAVLIDQP